MAQGMTPPGGAPKQPGQGGEGLDTIIEMGGDSESPFRSMVAGVSSALSKMQELLQGEGVPPEAIQKLAALDEQYKATLQEIMSSVGPQEDASTVAPGGAPGAVQAQ